MDASPPLKIDTGFRPSGTHSLWGYTATAAATWVRVVALRITLNRSKSSMIELMNVERSLPLYLKQSAKIAHFYTEIQSQTWSCNKSLWSSNRTLARPNRYTRGLKFEARLALTPCSHTFYLPFSRPSELTLKTFRLHSIELCVSLMANRKTFSCGVPQHHGVEDLAFKHDSMHIVCKYTDTSSLRSIPWSCSHGSP